MKTPTTSHKKKSAAATPWAWELRLYVADHTPKSITALRNLEQLCEEHLAGRYHIEVIDLKKNPELAQSHQILAVPTLVRKLPAPIRKVIGTLANTERVIAGLELRSHDAASLAARKLFHGRSERCCEPVCKMIFFASTAFRKPIASRML